MDDLPVFIGTIIPNGVSTGKQGLALHFSLCLEIDQEHPCVEKKSDGQCDFVKWCERIAGFNHARGELVKQLKSGLLFGFGESDRSFPMQRVEVTNPGIDTKHSVLWQDLLCVKSPRHPSVADRSIPDKAGEYLQGRTLITATSAAPDLLHAVTIDPAPAAIPTTNDVLARMIRSEGLGGLRALNSTEQQLIRAAADTQRGQARRRLEKLRNPKSWDSEAQFRDMDDPFHAQVKAVFDTYGVEAMKRRNDVMGLAGEALALIDVACRDLFLTPEYVCTAYDTLNASPQLRSLFGTTIGFTVTGEVVEQIRNATPQKPITIEVGPDHDKTYFRLGRSKLRSVHHASTWLGVAGWSEAAPEERTLEHSLMCFNPNKGWRDLSCDPQALAKAADEVQEMVAGLPRPSPNTVPSEPQSDPEPPAAPTPQIQNWLIGDDSDPLHPFEEEHLAVDGEQVRRALALVGAQCEQLALFTRMNNRIANVPTTGLSLYKLDPCPAQVPDAVTDGITTIISEMDMVKGYVVYARGVGQRDWISLTRLQEDLEWNGIALPSYADKDGSEFGIHVGGGVLMERTENGQTIKEILHDGFLFSWDGTGLSGQNPMRHFEKEGVETGTQEIVNRLERLRQLVDSAQPEAVVAQIKNRKLFGIDYKPFKKFDAGEPRPRLLAKRQYASPDAPRATKLRFGKAYEFVLAAQYHNGYVPVELNTVDRVAGEAHKVRTGTFRRHDHIKDLFIGLESTIYDLEKDKEQKALLPEHPGESPSDLVVRSGSLLNTRECVRLILPPPIPSFQTYLWYDQEDLRLMGGRGRIVGEGELSRTYQRYSCDARTASEYQDNIRRCAERDMILHLGCTPTGCQAKCRQYCGGTEQPLVYPKRLNYLPDPVVTGFVARFFLDPECTLPANKKRFPEKFCPYRQGRYPDLKPWRFVLHRMHVDDKKQCAVEADESDQELRVHLFPGMQLYVRVIPTFDRRHAHFAPPLIKEDVIPNGLLNGVVYSAKDEEHHWDLLHANAKVLSLTHAVQRPLFDPVIQQVTVRRFNERVAGEKQKPASAMEFHVQLHFEQLNVHYGAAIPETTPTGELELYALWNDYDPEHSEPVRSIASKRRADLPTGGFARMARKVYTSPKSGPSIQPATEHEPSPHAAFNYWTTIDFHTDTATCGITHFTDMVFRVRNGSKFYSYFHNGRASGELGDEHCRWSGEFRLSKNDLRVLQNDANEVQALFVPNNRKPEAPRIRKIVPVILHDREVDGKEGLVHGHRVRIYLEPTQRMSTGKEERVGLLVHEEHGIYNTYLHDHFSKAAKDVITDAFVPDSSPALHGDRLTAHEVVLDPDELGVEYMDTFKPQYDRAVFGDSGAIGLVSYVPSYDPLQGLWYFEPEFNIRNRDGQELHNTFVQLGLMGYQPFSANYNQPVDPSEKGYLHDLRVSQPVKADFFGVYPSRKYTNVLVLFGDDSREKFTFGGSVSSLFFYPWPGSGDDAPGRTLHSQFYAVVQEERTGGFWEKSLSTIHELELLIDGAIIAETYDGREMLTTPPSYYHPLLPADMDKYVASGERPTRSEFECAFRLDFETGLRRKRGGHFRVLIYEVEWFNYDEPISFMDGLLMQHDLPMIKDVRIKATYVFT